MVVSVVRVPHMTVSKLADGVAPSYIVRESQSQLVWYSMSRVWNVALTTWNRTSMMTSSHGNTLHITGLLFGESGYRCHRKVTRSFLCCQLKQVIEQTNIVLFSNCEYVQDWVVQFNDTDMEKWMALTKSQQFGPLAFSLLLAWKIVKTNNRIAVDFRRHHAQVTSL